MNWTATGHRADKLELYTEEQAHRLIAFADDVVQIYFKSPTVGTMYCGMQSGWDLAIGLAAMNRGWNLVPCLPYTNFLPYGQYNKRFWYSISSRILKAYKPVVVCPGDYAAWKLNTRNKFMVDHSSFVMALWDGSDSGTKNCIDYAISKQTPYENYWDRWMNVIK